MKRESLSSISALCHRLVNSTTYLCILSVPCHQRHPGPEKTGCQLRPLLPLSAGENLSSLLRTFSAPVAAVHSLCGLSGHSHGPRVYAPQATGNKTTTSRQPSVFLRSVSTNICREWGSNLQMYHKNYVL